MKQYLQLLEYVKKHGVEKRDRTGVGTLSIFGYQSRYDLNAGFPLLTTKKVHLRSIIYELLWFIRGDTNISFLKEANVTIWNEWADEAGNLGPVYGKQWRSWPRYSGDVKEGCLSEKRLREKEGHLRGTPETADKSGIDQITEVIEQLKTNPDSRRLIVCSWNVAQIQDMALPPCHCLFQFYVANGRLSCQLYQRSADIFLGVPFNIASYALLTQMIAQVVGLKLGDFIHTLGDAHLYLNHLEQAEVQLSRTPFGLPKMILNPSIKSIFDFKFEDFVLEEYQCHPAIKAPIAV